MLSHDLNILIVDDDEIDRENIQRAFSKVFIKSNLHFAVDGHEALGMLTGENGYKKLEKQPHLILLDINMPRMNGFELIEQIRGANPKQLPQIYILSTSDNDQDITKAYEYNISGYLLKPFDTQSINLLITSLCTLFSFQRFPKSF